MRWKILLPAVLMFFALRGSSAIALDQQEWCKRIDTSSTNITNAFSGFAVIDFGGNTPKKITAVNTINLSAIEIAVNCSGVGSTAPSGTSAYNHYIAAGFGYGSPPNAVYGKSCFVRSMGATISTGIVVICITGF